MTYRVDEHVALELRIVEEALFAPVIVTLELSEGLRVSIMDGLKMSGLEKCTVKCYSTSSFGNIATY